MFRIPFSPFPCTASSVNVTGGSYSSFGARSSRVQVLCQPCLGDSCFRYSLPDQSQGGSGPHHVGHCKFYQKFLTRTSSPLGSCFLEKPFQRRDRFLCLSHTHCHLLPLSIHSFTHSLNRYLMRTHCVSCSLLGIGMQGGQNRVIAASLKWMVGARELEQA